MTRRRKRYDKQFKMAAARVALGGEMRAVGLVLMFTKNWSSWSRFSEHRGHE